MSTRLNYMYTFLFSFFFVVFFFSSSPKKINKRTLIYSMDIGFVPNGYSNSDGGFTTLEWKI